MPLPEGLAELLLEELGRPALVFEGKKLVVANRVACNTWGPIVPSTTETQPAFLSPLEWTALEEYLSTASLSQSPACGPLSPIGRVNSDGLISDERVKAMCVRSLFERTKICDLVNNGTDYQHVWANAATDLLINGNTSGAQGAWRNEPGSTRVDDYSVQQFVDCMKHAIAEGTAESKMHMVWKGGRCRSVKIWMEHIEGKRVGWILQALRDVDELADSLEFMRSFFENAPFCMAVAETNEEGTDYQISVKNYYFSQTFGTSIRPPTQVWSPQEMAKWLAAMAAARDSKSPQRFEIKARTIDAHGVLDLLVTTVHIRDRFFAIIIEDVTRWKEAQAKVQQHSEELERAVAERTAALEEALQVKNRFLAVVSHELRTPVAGVLGTMELLGETLLTAEQQTLLSTARTCGEQLSVVINDILDFTRIQENKVVLEDNVFSLHLLLEEVLDISVFNPARRPAIELILDIDPAAPNLVKGDVTRLRQILLNLVSNAIKFTEQGEVHVTLTRKADQLIVDVRDTGIGIAPAVRDRLFHPFQQGDTSVTRRFGGSGLGLCISKNLAQLMGGDLTFVSELGHGTIFTLSWPLRVQSETPCTPRKDLSSLYVLIIVANATLRTVLSNRVTQFGCRSASFPDCEKAAEALISASASTHGRKVFLIDADLAVGFFYDSLRRMLDSFTVLLGYDYSISSAFLKKPVKGAALLTLLEETARTRLSNMTADGAAATLKLGANNSREKSDGKPASRHALRILVAEDNPSNQFVLRKYLDLLGYVHCTVVENGLEALRAVQKQSFDLILMDVMMPVMGGIEATEQILNMKLAKPPVIVALTAHVFKEDQQRCLRAGMAGVLTKPIRRPDLQATLEKIERERYQIAAPETPPGNSPS